jgi:hypothetical protein
MVADPDLITLAEIGNLPEDPRAAFIEFERICRARMTEWIKQLGERESDVDLRLEYMGRVAAAAREFDIEGFKTLVIPSAANYSDTYYRNFAQAATAMVTQLQIRSVRRIKESSVELELSDKRKIEHHIQQIRTRVAESKLSERKKSHITAKLNALQEALDGKRLDLAKVAVIIASVTTFVNQAEGVVIKLPEAITAIMQVVGTAKDKEMNTTPMLHGRPTPLAIESKIPEEAEEGEAAPTSFNRDEMDDEIPF